MQPFPLASLTIQPQPHLSWVGAKTRASVITNKNRPGRKEEHTEALAMNALFVPTPAPESTDEVSTEFAPETTPDPEPTVA